MAVVLGIDEGVVIERPQSAVTETVVEPVDFLGCQGDRSLADSVEIEWLVLRVRIAGPSHP